MDRTFQIEKKVGDYLKENGFPFPGLEGVRAAVSGGPDSVALLLILKAVLPTLAPGVRLEAVHVEHGIRGEESLMDQAFVEALCRDKDIPLTVVPVDAPAYSREEGLSMEEAARVLRYRAIRPGDHMVTATAHQMDDNAETMLLQICRGSGWRGAAGLPFLNGRGIIRPLLCLTRSEIIAYLGDRGQAYRTDSTNMDPSLTRNKIRLTILPLLENVNPAFREHFFRTSRAVRLAGEEEEKELSSLLYDLTVDLSGEEGKVPVSRRDGTYPYRVAACLDRKALKKAFPPGGGKGGGKNRLLLGDLLRLWLVSKMPMSGRDLSSDQVLHAADLAVGPTGREYFLPGSWLIRSGRDRLLLLAPKEGD